MTSPSHSGKPPVAALKFGLIEKQPLPPAAILLALILAATAASAIAYALNPTKPSKFRDGGTAASRAAGEADDDKDDDPNQVDVVVLGDAADAPVPARRRRGKPGNVHATILVHLPRFGPQQGLIPNSGAGHLLYGWLAAFNQASPDALRQVLPTAASASAVAAQMQLRQQTGGYNMVSAQEVEPGILVFRLRDQTPQGGEALGTLHVREGSNPPAIASFSLRSAAEN